MPREDLPWEAEELLEEGLCEEDLREEELRAEEPRGPCEREEEPREEDWPRDEAVLLLRELLDRPRPWLLPEDCPREEPPDVDLDPDLDPEPEAEPDLEPLWDLLLRDREEEERALREDEEDDRRLEDRELPLFLLLDLCAIKSPFLFAMRRPVPQDATR